MHKHKEPGEMFENIARTLSIVGFSFFIVFLAVAVVSFYKNGEITIYARFLMFLIAIAGVTITILTGIVLDAIRTNKMVFLEKDKQGCFLKVYPDGCMRPGRIFWKSGGKTHKTEEKEEDFDSKKEFEGDIDICIKKSIQSSHMRISITVTIYRIGFSVVSYKQAVLDEGFSSFEFFVKMMLVPETRMFALHEYIENHISYPSLLRMLSESYISEKVVNKFQSLGVYKIKIEVKKVEFSAKREQEITC